MFPTHAPVRKYLVLDIFAHTRLRFLIRSTFVPLICFARRTLTVYGAGFRHIRGDNFLEGLRAAYGTTPPWGMPYASMGTNHSVSLICFKATTVPARPYLPGRNNNVCDSNLLIAGNLHLITRSFTLFYTPLVRRATHPPHSRSLAARVRLRERRHALSLSPEHDVLPVRGNERAVRVPHEPSDDHRPQHCGV